MWRWFFIRYARKMLGIFFIPGAFSLGCTFKGIEWNTPATSKYAHDPAFTRIHFQQMYLVKKQSGSEKMSREGVLICHFHIKCSHTTWKHLSSSLSFSLILSSNLSQISIVLRIRESWHWFVIFNICICCVLLPQLKHRNKPNWNYFVL